MKRLLPLLFIVGLCNAAYGQTWYTLVPASQQSLSTIVTLPVGTTYRIGDPVSNRWTTPIVVTATTTRIIDYADGGVGHPPDPAPGVAKEFDVLETTIAQPVTVNGVSKSAPAAPMTTYTITCTGTVTYPSGTPPTTLNITAATCTATKQ